LGTFQALAAVGALQFGGA